MNAAVGQQADSSAGVGRLGGRRRQAALILGQLLAGIGVASGVAVGGLLAEQLSGRVEVAGFAQTSSVLGAGLWAIPLARLAGRHGRHWGLGVGYLLAVVGTVSILLAPVLHALPLLFGGLAAFGAATAAGLQARFAATEQASPAYRARAMSIVLWATTLGSVAGPNLSQAGADLGRRLGIEPLTGPYLFSLVAFTAAMLITWLGLHDRRPTGAGSAGPDIPEHRLALLPALRLSLRSRATVTAVVAVVCSHTVMVGVMVMTPVHMHHSGLTLDLVGLVISVHILGMYAASPLMGWLTDRIGPVRVILIGCGILTAALLLAGLGAGGGPLWLTLALGLLGLGWSAGMIGGSALLASAVEPAARTSVQGASDALMNLSAAASAATSGVVLGAAGYPGLAVVAGFFVAPMLVLALTLAGRGRP